MASTTRPACCPCVGRACRSSAIAGADFIASQGDKENVQNVDVRRLTSPAKLVPTTPASAAKPRSPQSMAAAGTPSPSPSPIVRHARYPARTSARNHFQASHRARVERLAVSGWSSSEPPWRRCAHLCHASVPRRYRWRTPPPLSPFTSVPARALAHTHAHTPEHTRPCASGMRDRGRERVYVRVRVRDVCAAHCELSAVRCVAMLHGVCPRGSPLGHARLVPQLTARCAAAVRCKKQPTTPCGVRPTPYIYVCVCVSE
jgi:hypothetical protein